MVDLVIYKKSNHELVFVFNGVKTFESILCKDSEYGYTYINDSEPYLHRDEEGVVTVCSRYLPDYDISGIKIMEV